jgi:RHS repeat-associated protein
LKKIEYEYNASGVLLKEKQEDDLTDNTYITQITPKETFPFCGAPETVEQIIVSKGKPFLQKKVCKHFDEKGRCVQQDVYDTKNTLRYPLQYTYDEKGHLTEKTDSLGRVTTYTYDAKNRLLSSSFLGETQEFLYDAENRPTTEKHLYADGTSTTISKEYDLLGNLLFTTDPFGNKTSFTYDEWGRLLSTAYPQIIDENEKIQTPIIQYTYDIFDNIIEKKTPKGYLTYYTYNLHNKPTSISYPDGSTERFRYDEEGSLHRKVDRNGLIWIYQFDDMGHMSKIEKFSQGPRGPDQFMGEEIKEYTAFDYNSFCNAENEQVTYEYSRGKVVSESLAPAPADSFSQSPESCYEKDFLYDSWGNVFGEKIYQGKSALIKRQRRDTLGKLQEEKIEDSNGNVYTHTKFLYDSQDNLQKILLGNKPMEEREYDAFHFPKKITDAAGAIKTIQSNYFYENALGQKVMQRTIQGPLGSQTIFTYDVFQRVISIEKKDSHEKLLFVEKIRYDVEGHISRIMYQDLVSQKTSETSWVYGPMDHMEKLKENIGTPTECETTFLYNTKDQLIEEKKGSSKGSIRYFYEASGFLCKVSFLDATGKKVKTELECDRLGRIVKAFSDTVSVERTYNPMQLIDMETISYDKKSYTVKYEYDTQGRLISIALPDKSQVRYIYSPHYLKQVQRINAKGQTYTHAYLSYETQGKVVQEELMHGQTRVSKYDLAGRKIESSTDIFSEKMEYDLLGNLISVQEKGHIRTQQKTYSYDSLSQLLSEKGFFSHSYLYDAMFHRLSKDGKKYSYESNHLCVSSPEGTFSYDSSGNLMARKVLGKETFFSYDGLNHLTEVKENEKKVTYIYDPFGRRVSKIVDADNTTKDISYIFVGDQEIGSFEGKELQDLYVLGQDGKPVGIEISGEMYVPYLDNQDNVIALFSMSSSEICEIYHYSAFGEESISDRGESYSISPQHNLWRYKGGRTEEESGLIFFHNRFYDPILGRWLTPDPLGPIDGPNLYAYVKNNPLKYSDHWGLSGKDNYYQGANFEEYFDHERHNPNYRPGEVYARVRSYEEESMPLFSFAEGWSTPFRLKTEEVPHGMIGFINGIETPRLSAYEHASFLSKLGQGVNIHGVYNATHGLLSDLGESVLSLMGISSSRPVNLLRQQWRGFFDREKKNPFLQICHSQGALHVYNALQGMTPEERDRIIVVTVAPAKYITRKYCLQATNYASKRDFVPWIDVKGRRNCQQGELVVLEPHKDAPLIDHSFESPTYTESINIEMKKYIKSIKE